MDSNGHLFLKKRKKKAGKQATWRVDGVEGGT